MVFDQFRSPVSIRQRDAGCCVSPRWVCAETVLQPLHNKKDQRNFNNDFMILVYQHNFGRDKIQGMGGDCRRVLVACHPAHMMTPYQGNHLVLGERTMARRKYGLNEQKILRFMKEGRGVGFGRNYKPWFTVSDVPSRGRSHRVFWSTTDRTHHLLSDTEFLVFLHLIWGSGSDLLEDIQAELQLPGDEKASVEDIREQFPLPRRATVRIAKMLGIRHPIDRQSKALWVVTTDFVVTIKTQSAPLMVAVAVKTSDTFEKPRVLKNLEIERMYWEERHVPWFVVSDIQVKTRLGRNLKWIFDGSSSPDCITEADKKVWRILAKKKNSYPHVPIKEICKSIDLELSYAEGTALGTLRRLLGWKLITVDLHVRQIQDLPIRKFCFVNAIGVKGGAICQSDTS